MEDKLVTLAILTYTKAQILKNVLENEGIETYIHNVTKYSLLYPLEYAYELRKAIYRMHWKSQKALLGYRKV